MTFDELLEQVLALLQRQGRVAYRALKVRFSLDDDHLEALKDELIYARQVAVDEEGRVLVRTGDTGVARPPTSLAAREQGRAPVAYTPPHLAEKILTSRSALEGERKQVTVLFADIKDSTELIKDLDPEAAQQLIDPAIHIMSGPPLRTRTMPCAPATRRWPCRPPCSPIPKTCGASTG